MRGDTAISSEEYWRQVDSLSLRGRIVLLGSQDRGKSTLATHLVRRLAEDETKVAWIDGDIGQSTLGLPTTLNLALAEKGTQETPPPCSTFFVGKEDASEAQLPLLTGLKRLQERSAELKAETLVVDTTGFVDKKAGGLVLKEYKLKLLQPDVILALQGKRELEPLLAPLRKHPGLWVQTLTPLPGARAKTREHRIQSRRKKFQKHFHGARETTLNIPRLPVYELPRCKRNSLLGLLDEQGYCLSLATAIGQEGDSLRLYTPLSSPEEVAAVRISPLRLDPLTGLTY